MAEISNKHFLDSTIVQEFLLGTNSYKQYLAEQFGNNRIYISYYVQMEIKRSCLIPLINFYFTLEMPSCRTVGDAVKLWSHRFKGSEIKAVLRFIGDLLDTHQLENIDENKEVALRRIGIYIKRMEIVLRKKFCNIGINATRCARAEVPFNSPQIEELNLKEQLNKFANGFNDVSACRDKCRVDHFILVRLRTEVEKIIDYASKLERPKSPENQGFIEIVDNLEKILIKGPSSCSCRLCGEIGDAVIALEAPPNMRLEHIDNSFDNLCTVLNRPHYKHPSEISLSKQT